MRAVRFPTLRDTRPSHLAAGWPAVRQALSHHAVREDKLRGALWSPVEYQPNTTRRNGNVKRVFAFVVDLDGVALDALRPRLRGLEWHAYTTYSHSPDKPSWHVVLPLAQPVAAREWRRAWLTIRAWLGMGDEQTCDASRAYFLPQRHPDREAEVECGIGLWLDWRDLPKVEAPSMYRASAPGSHAADLDWDDVEIPAELEGLEGQDLIHAALAYVEDMLDRLRAA